MTGQALKEFIRRLEAEGYKYTQKHGYTGTVYGDSGEYATIEGNGDILFPPEYRQFALRVSAIRDEVNEYMAAFLAAAPDANHQHGVNSDTRTLLLFNGHELAGRLMPNDVIDFVTWQHDRNGQRQTGHYFNDYPTAKQDFVVRAGLINRDKLFTETELTVIRSSLSDYIALDGGEHISWEQEDRMKDIIGKIDNIIVPEIQEQTQEAKEESYEPESEL